MDNVKKNVIIVAGGSGTRMGVDIPKQFLKLGSKPILMHTIEAFAKCGLDINIIITLPQGQIEYWKTICNEYNFLIPHIIIKGGNTRFQSVRNGLAAIEGSGLVAIHDGVRPFVSKEIISESYKVAHEKGNSVVAVKLKDSIRMLENGENKAMDRNLFYLIQTPQTFKIELIKRAFDVEDSPVFTDDATVLESIGEKINLIEGDYNNIKITTKEDLVVGNALIEVKNG